MLTLPECQTALKPRADQKAWRKVRRLAFLVIGLVALTNAGCVPLLVGGAAAAGVAGYSYYAGKLQGDFPASVAQTEVAARTAVQDLGCTVFRADSGVIEGRTPEGDRLTVYVDPSPDELVSRNGMPLTLTRVTVRIGMFGDDVFSEKILDRVNFRLGNVPSSPTKAAPLPQPVVRKPVVRKPIVRGEPSPVPGWQQKNRPPQPTFRTDETGPPPLAANETGPPPLPSNPKTATTVPSRLGSPTTSEPPLAEHKQVQWTTETSGNR